VLCPYLEPQIIAYLRFLTGYPGGDKPQTYRLRNKDRGWQIHNSQITL